MLIKVITFFENFSLEFEFSPRKCFRCDHFPFNGRDEKTHNFLSHYQQGGRRCIEDNPLNRIYFDENLQKYRISFSEHGKHYDFYDSREIVTEFLTAFENYFIPRPNLRKVRFKCTFTIINRQPPLDVGFVEITSARVWVTNVYDGIYFGEIMKASLAEDIRNRVIANGKTGSSWRFKRFERIHSKIFILVF